jgi:hypothetical protein
MLNGRFVNPSGTSGANDHVQFECHGNDAPYIGRVPCGLVH